MNMRMEIQEVPGAMLRHDGTGLTNTRENFCERFSPGAPGCSVEMFDELAVVAKENS